jgi:hypothetical protein
MPCCSDIFPRARARHSAPLAFRVGPLGPLDFSSDLRVHRCTALDGSAPSNCATPAQASAAAVSNIMQWRGGSPRKCLATSCVHEAISWASRLFPQARASGVLADPVSEIRLARTQPEARLRGIVAGELDVALRIPFLRRTGLRDCPPHRARDAVWLGCARLVQPGDHAGKARARGQGQRSPRSPAR